MQGRLGFLWAAIAIMAVMLGLQIPKLRAHQAWAGGRATTMGHVDKISDGRKIREAFYSYEVGGKTFQGDVVDDSYHFDVGPQAVIYALEDPSVSALSSEDNASEYRVSVIVAILSPLPVILVVGAEIRRRFKLRESAK